MSILGALLVSPLILIVLIVGICSTYHDNGREGVVVFVLGSATAIMFICGAGLLLSN